MNNFKIGDQVMYHSPHNLAGLNGKIGTVVTFDNNNYDTDVGVQFDDSYEGNTLSGRLKNNHGRWCSRAHLVVYEQVIIIKSGY